VCFNPALSREPYFRVCGVCALNHFSDPRGTLVHALEKRGDLQSGVKYYRTSQNLILSICHQSSPKLL
jgi:hypothetical protein